MAHLYVYAQTEKTQGRFKATGGNIAMQLQEELQQQEGEAAAACA